jgi:hypothetical protein
MTERTRTTFKVTVAGRRVVDFSTLRKGDKFILQDDDHPLSMEKGNVCNVATSDAYLRGGIWTIDCEEIEGSVKRIKRGSHPDDWAPANFRQHSRCLSPLAPFESASWGASLGHREGLWTKPFTIKATAKVTKEDLLNNDPIWPFEQTHLSDVVEEIMEIEDKRILATLLGASKDFLDGPTTHFQVWEDEGSYSVPVQFAEEVAALQSKAGGEE